MMPWSIGGYEDGFLGNIPLMDVMEEAYEVS